MSEIVSAPDDRVPANLAPAGLGHATPAPDDAALLTSIAHDLRSPLAGLVALVDRLESGADGALTEPQRRRIGRIHEALNRLTGLADGIADLAQMLTGRLTLSRGAAGLHEIAASARQALEPMLRARGVSLQIMLPPELPPVMVDPIRLRQMITTIVSAMIRRIQGTALEIAADARGATVEVTLREASRGIPVEALPEMFSPLDPIEARPAVVEHDELHGVDCQVARRLALLHGGSLTMGRDAEGALAASFVLPIAGGDAVPHADRPADLRKTT